MAEGKKENIMKSMRSIVRLAGLWEGPKAKDAYWSYLMRACFILSVISQIILLFTVTDDKAKLFKCFSYLTFCGMCILKLFSLRMRYKDWLSILARAQDLEDLILDDKQIDTEYESDSETEDNLVQKDVELYEKKYRYVSTFIIRFYAFTLTIFLVAPVLEYAYYRINHVEVDLPHVLPGWSPLNNMGIAGNSIMIVIEITAATYCVFVHLVFDVIATGVIIFLTGQFALLRKKSSMIGGRGKDYQFSEARDLRAHFRIIECHRIHIVLVQLIKDLDKLLQWISGVHYFVATTTLCSLAVTFSQEQLSAMQYASSLQYMAGLLLQLFLFCYFGDTVLNESYTRMGEGASAASCWCLRAGVSRELYLLSVGLSKQHRLKAGQFNSLDLPSFVQILRMAYSCYALLHNAGQ